jgi:hypothetical protein
LALLALLTVGCVDRAIDFTACRDGYLERGEICFADATLPLRPDFDPLALRVADFDGSGHFDVLVLGVDSDSVVVADLLRGDGEGGFAEAVDAGITGCSAYPAPGDIDGDGVSDLLVDDCGPSVSLFYGSPEGFDGPVTVETGAATRTSGLLDIDGDATTDVVILGSDDALAATLNVARGRGARTFDPPLSSPMLSPGTSFEPGGFGIGDFDEDGRLDALLVDPTAAGGFAIAFGEGAGRFAAPTPTMADVPPGGAWVRDVDDDGHLDVLVHSPSPSALVFARGNGTGAFEVAAMTELPSAPRLTAALGDIDDDGDLDVLFVYPEQSTVETWLGRPDGSFEGPSSIDVGGAPLQIELVDLDEDGARDLVVGTFEDGGIRIVLARP